MTSIVLKKNIYMKKRFGVFKSIVYRKIKLCSFKKYVNILTSNEKITTNNKQDLILCVKKLFDYLSRTKDIWWCLEKFSNTVKEKSYKLYEEPMFKEYLLNFGYICPYTLICGQECGRRLYSGRIMCPLHTYKTNKLKVIISENIKIIHKDLQNIIFKYISSPI